MQMNYEHSGLVLRIDNAISYGIRYAFERENPAENGGGPP